MTRWLRIIARSIAIAIAVAGAIDPAISRAVLVNQPLTVVASDDASVIVAQRVRDALADATDARVSVRPQNSRAAACPAAGGCVIVSDGSVPARLTAGSTVLGAVRVSSRPLIAGVDAPARVSLNAVSSVRATLTQSGPGVEVWDDGVRVGSVDASDRLVVDVPWVPAAAGTRALRVVAGGDAADLAVVVDGTPAAVLLYEPETTWAGSFLRRALEDDSRFEVAGRTDVAPRVAVGRGATGGLTAASLSAVSSVVLVAPDTLPASAVTLLERFVRWRGGSLVVVLDRRPTGPVRTLLPAIVRERLEPNPVQAGMLETREILSFERSSGVIPIATAGDDAVVVWWGLGRGRVIVSGALDAWKFRAGDNGFETFWRSVVWDAAMAAGPPVRVSADRSIVRPGDEIRVEATLQSMTELGGEVGAVGSVECGGERAFLRLWPQPRPGVFSGTFLARGTGDCRIQVTLAGQDGETHVAVRPDVRRPAPDGVDVSAAMAAHGGLVVASGNEAELLNRVREALPPQPGLLETYPMRSVWWIVPFVTALGTEWLLRRRAGLR